MKNKFFNNKKWEQYKRLPGQHQAYWHSHYKSAQKKRTKGASSLSEDIIADSFPNLGKEIGIQVQEAESPKQDQPKEDHTKTYCN